MGRLWKLTEELSSHEGGGEDGGQREYPLMYTGAGGGSACTVGGAALVPRWAGSTQPPDPERPCCGDPDATCGGASTCQSGCQACMSPTDVPVDPSTGNVAYQAGTVKAGGFAPDVMFTYNAQSTETGVFGFGWASNIGQSLAQPDANTVVLTKQMGQTRVYTADGHGGYTPPVGIVNTLVKNGDGSFTETTPQGFEYRYSGVSGLLARATDPQGNVSTYAYDSGNHLQTILAPTGQITTFAHNAGGQITSVTDAAGRQDQGDWNVHHLVG